MLLYDIADKLIGIEARESQLTDKFNIFSSAKTRLPDFNVVLRECDFINKPSGELVINESVKWLLSNDIAGNTISYVCGEQSEEALAMFEVDKEWKNASVAYLKGKENDDYNFSGLIGEMLFRNFIIMHQGIEIHAAALNWEGKGIIFSAPSGTGKSTQAQLWKSIMGANVINGDRPIVRILSERPVVYGTPWTATSPDCLNSSAPLSAIIMLVKAPINNIRQLTKDEIISWLLPRCFLPYHNKRLMDLAISNFENIISKVPVYLLRCKPDKEAVELVYQCIK